MAKILKIGELLKKFEKDKEKYRFFLKDFILADDLPKIDKYDVDRILELGGMVIKSFGVGLCLMDAVRDALSAKEFKYIDVSNAKGVLIAASCKTMWDYQLMKRQKDELHRLFTADDLNVRFGVIIRQEQYHNIEMNVLITGI